MRWDGGNGLWSFEPPLPTILVGFPFQTSCQKAAVCKTQASGCDLRVTVGGAKPTIGVTHADFLAHQPVCLENPSVEVWRGFSLLHLPGCSLKKAGEARGGQPLQRSGLLRNGTV